MRYTQAGLLTQTFKRTSPSSRNKHPSDIAERHSANTATALCGILTRLPFSPTTIGWTPVYQLYSLVFLFYQGALGMSRWNKRKYVVQGEWPRRKPGQAHSASTVILWCASRTAGRIWSGNTSRLDGGHQQTVNAVGYRFHSSVCWFALQIWEPLLCIA